MMEVDVKRHCMYLYEYECEYIQRPAKVDAPGCVKYVPAVTYHFCQFCLNLPPAFTQL